MSKRYVELHRGTCGFIVIEGCIESGAEPIHKAGTRKKAMRWIRDQHEQSVKRGGPKWHVGVRA